ncbi:glycosyltransferase family 1 protein [Methylobacterium sp. Leaf466]|uniref:glycosyltransferase family 4 protein n=1 Tax=Methylobacterium sp. Leaf466 TaxID=1736386 RepID=UPI000701C9B2|nr:glycosyltransferase family 1 protein [Methylobacterium sp. Leaf466]KQT78978.1 glycosyl transferase family 1 [Methylobacterium sp. Leaf466]
MPAIAIDLTRLITRLSHASPSGIDRVDLAYARHVLDQPGDRFGLVSTMLGPRVLDRAGALAVVEAAATGWEEDRDALADPVYRGLIARLGGAAGPAGAPAAGPRRRTRVRIEAALRTLRAGGHEALPQGTLYLHTSHLRLDKPGRFDWLYDRPDVRAVFFVHDLIPIAYPEYGRPGEDARHAVRMETMARHADHVIANSADVAGHFSRHLAANGLRARPVSVAPLGVETVFCEADRATAFAPGRPVFVACGTIEPRKNHLLLLNLWRRLAADLGEATPHLVIVGRRGWEAENVIDMLDRCPAIEAHVTEVHGLSTHGLAGILRGATALLMPSFAEGYGIPVVEAAACGLPVVASDIPVHREVGSGFATLIDPLDGPGWRDAILALSEPGSETRAAMADRLRGYAPPTWRDHFALVDPILATFA